MQQQISEYLCCLYKYDLKLPIDDLIYLNKIKKKNFNNMTMYISLILGLGFEYRNVILTIFKYSHAYKYKNIIKRSILFQEINISKTHYSRNIFATKQRQLHAYNAIFVCNARAQHTRHPSACRQIAPCVGHVNAVNNTRNEC